MELFQLPFSTDLTTTTTTLSFVLLLFLFNLVLVLRRSFSSETRQLPPGPWKLPFIGSIHHLLTADSQIPHRALRSLSKRYGPLMHLQLGEVSLVVVSSPSMAEQVCKTHDLAFAQRPQQLVATKASTYDNQTVSFAPYSAYWRQIRKTCMVELLTAKRVRSSAFIREEQGRPYGSQKSWAGPGEEEVTKLVISIKSSSLGGGEDIAMNVTEKLYSLFNVVTARAAFGKQCKDKDVFVETLLELSAMAGTPHLCDMFPSLKILDLVRRRWKDKIENLHRRCDMVMDKIVKDHERKQILANTEERGNSGSESREEEDLVDALIRQQKSCGLECPINVKAVIQDMFGGGTETSSSTIASAMSELMREPRVMEKAQSEVRDALKGNKIVLHIDIQGLKYHKMVVRRNSGRSSSNSSDHGRTYIGTGGGYSPHSIN